MSFDKWAAELADHIAAKRQVEKKSNAGEPADVRALRHLWLLGDLPLVSDARLAEFVEGRRRLWPDGAVKKFTFNLMTGRAAKTDGAQHD